MLNHNHEKNRALQSTSRGLDAKPEVGLQDKFRKIVEKLLLLLGWRSFFLPIRTLIKSFLFRFQLSRSLTKALFLLCYWLRDLKLTCLEWLLREQIWGWWHQDYPRALGNSYLHHTGREQRQNTEKDHTLNLSADRWKRGHRLENVHIASRKAILL